MSAAMYLEHYGLSEAPFRITADPGYFFSGAERGATLDALLFTLRFEEGIVKVTGEVGAGKTMLLRMLLERLPAEALPVWLANPSLTPEQLLQAIARQIGVPPDAQSENRLLDAIEQRLITLYGEGRRVIVLVDEAHAMPSASLEQVRLLSNLETPRHKLLQIVLFGQPELDALLAGPTQRPLRDRITHHFRLAPLSAAETRAYLLHRLQAAGHRGRPPLSVRAMNAISRSAAGLTRRINILADKTLLAGFAAGKHDIGLREVRLAARDAGLPDPLPIRSAAALVALTVTGVAALLYAMPGRIASGTSATAAPTAAPEVPAARAAVSPAASAATMKTAPPHADLLGSFVAERLMQSRDWVAQSKGERWTVQVGAAAPEQARELEALIHRIEALGDGTPVNLYAAPGTPVGRIGVVWGDFASAAEARSAVAAAPDWLRIARPYVRPIASIRPAPRKAKTAKAAPAAAESNSVKMGFDPTAPEEAGPRP
ncbi:AAA family ATPase [Niveibacterium sp. COAC-50]|uniref:ExeA family protein n=1 Tax=Niveibacterium sp. COAC-50 TaxID=2729384 RepID=UPI0015549A96